MIKRSFVLTLMASSLLSPLSSVRAETLRDSVQQALETHPAIEAAQIGEEIAKQDFKEARSGLFPEIEASLSAGRVFADTSTTRGLSVTRGAAYSWMGEGNATLTQPIFDGKETLNRMDAAQARSQSASYNVLDVRENLALRAVQAHLAIMQAQATLENTKDYYDVIESYLERIQLMVDEGVADQAEVSQAENISLMLESALVDYKGQLDAAYANYQEVVGIMPKSELVKPSLASVKVMEDVEQAIQHTKANHPLILSGERELQAAQHDIEAERAGYYPDFDSELSYLKKDQCEEIGGEVVDARALLRMSWDFEVGGGQKARTSRSRAEYSEILAQNRETVRTIEGEVRRAYAEFNTAKKQLNLVEARKDVTQELFDAYEVQFEGARVRLLQLMQAENQLFNAKSEAITAEYRYLLAQYSLLASMGQLLSTMNSPEIEVERVVKTRDEEQEIEITKEGGDEELITPMDDSDITSVSK